MDRIKTMEGWMKFLAVGVGSVNLFGVLYLEVHRWYLLHGMTAFNLSNLCYFLNPVNSSFARAECHLPHAVSLFSRSSEYKFIYVIDTISWKNRHNFPLAQRFQYARSAAFLHILTASTINSGHSLLNGFTTLFPYTFQYFYFLPLRRDNNNWWI